MIQQRMHHIGSEMPNITISQASFRIGWEYRMDGGGYADYFGINVNPDNMNWTVTKDDTGDGTAWVSCTPSTGTGDREDPNMMIRSEEENTTGLERSADIRFLDDSGDADDVVITVTQDVNPI